MESQSSESPGEKKVFFRIIGLRGSKAIATLETIRGLVPNQSRNCSWDRTGRLLANFFPCPYQQSQKSLRKLTRPSSLLVLLGKGNNRFHYIQPFVCLFSTCYWEGKREVAKRLYLLKRDCKNSFLGPLFV